MNEGGVACVLVCWRRRPSSAEHSELDQHPLPRSGLAPATGLVLSLGRALPVKLDHTHTSALGLYSTGTRTTELVCHGPSFQNGRQTTTAGEDATTEAKTSYASRALERVTEE